MTSTNKKITHWHLLSSSELHNKYYIPQAIAYDKENVFYTNCDGQVAISDNLNCKFVGLVPNKSDYGLVSLYLGGFSLSDLFDLYEYEILEAGTFNFLEVIDGHLSLNKVLSLELITILENYALQMSETEELLPGVFTNLSQTELARYRINTYPNHIQEVYRLTLPYNPTFNEDVTTFVSFTRAANRPSIYGIGLTQFIEREFQGNPKFQVFINGQGYIYLTKQTLLKLISMLRRWTEYLLSV